MSNYDAIREELRAFKDVAEIEFKYSSGNKTTYSFKDKKSREEALNQVVGDVDFTEVEKVKIKYEGGQHKKIEVEKNITRQSSDNIITSEIIEEMIAPVEQLSHNELETEKGTAPKPLKPSKKISRSNGNCDITRGKKIRKRRLTKRYENKKR